MNRAQCQQSGDPSSGYTAFRMTWGVIFLLLTLFSLQTFAGDSISVRVSTNEPSAAAIGFSVVGKKLGGMGKSYMGTGPRNQLYLFGYRKSVFGKNIPCGSQRLRQNSNVVLLTKNNTCRSIVRKMPGGR